MIPTSFGSKNSSFPSLSSVESKTTCRNTTPKSPSSNNSPPPPLLSLSVYHSLSLPSPPPPSLFSTTFDSMTLTTSGSARDHGVIRGQTSLPSRSCSNTRRPAQPRHPLTQGSARPDPTMVFSCSLSGWTAVRSGTGRPQRPLSASH